MCVVRYDPNFNAHDPMRIQLRSSLLFTVIFAVQTLAQAQVKPVFETEVLTSTSKQRLVEVDVPLKGARELHLVVSDEGGNSCDWADWLAPKLVMKDGSVRELTEIDWKDAKAGYGKIQVNKNVMGGVLTVEGKAYEKGIGTHAPATMEYSLPEGTDRFQVILAIDDGGMIRDGKPSTASLRFRIYTQKPPISASGAFDPDAPKLVPTDLFAVPEGLEVTVWATSPMLRSPTNMDFDAHGRLYVAEGVNYRGKGGRQPEGDRIVILEDTDHSGSADKSTVFVQEPDLASPLGVAVLDETVVVSQPPSMLVYRDRNGNGRIDPTGDGREVLLTGFSGRQHDHSLHSVTAGPNGQWFWNQGNTGAQFTDRSGKTFFMGSPYQMQEIAGKRSDDGHIWIGGFAARMNPDGSQVTIIGHNFRNSYELAVTSYGDVFQSDNDDPPACRVSHVLEGGNAGFASADGLRSWGADKRPGQDTPTAEWRQEDPGTMSAGDVYGGGSPTGVAYYENGALDPKWNGLLLACEAGKNVVFGYLPVAEGAGFRLERFDFLTSNKEKEFAGSDFLGGKPNGELKTMFRPSDVCVGPDGAIYVADWFDARVGGHGTLDEGTSGTIYRIAPKGFQSKIPVIHLDTSEGQIAALKSPAVNVRHSGFVRLKTNGAASIPAVATLLEEANPSLSARGIWLLAQLGDEGIAKVTELLDSKDATTRLVAYRALRFVGHEVISMATRMADDDSAAIRREVALTMRDLPAAESVAILTRLALSFDGKDRSYLEAFGLGSEGKEAEVYAAVSKKMGGPATDWSDAFAWIAWRLHPTGAAADFKTRALLPDLSEEQRKRMLTALAFVKSREAAGMMIDLAHTEGFPMKDLAMWWLLNRKGNDWNAYDVEGGLKALGLYDPANVKITAVEMPTPVGGGVALPSADEIGKLTGNPAKGQVAIAVCYTCHKVGDAGIEYGPDLTTFGRQQPAGVIISAIVSPSADISHGFEGSTVALKDGTTVTGMVLSSSDPLIIKCMGGLVQTIPQERIQSVAPLGRSLMYDPANLGLTAEAVADITAYLKRL